MANSISITGSFGPGASIATGDRKYVNIAGGEGSGDFYRVTDRKPAYSFDDTRKLLDGLAMPQVTKDGLNKTIGVIESAVQSTAGDSWPGPNLGLVEMLLSGTALTFPTVGLSLSQAILAESDSPFIRSVAQRASGVAVRQIPIASQIQLNPAENLAGDTGSVITPPPQGEPAEQRDS